MKLKLVKVTGGLAPLDMDGQAYLRSIANDSLVIANVSNPRNNSFLRKYFSLLNMIIKNIDTQAVLTTERLHEVVKDELGYSTAFLFDGKVYKESGSVSFDKMEEYEFSLYFSKAKDYLLTLVPIDDAIIANKIANY